MVKESSLTVPVLGNKLALQSDWPNSYSNTSPLVLEATAEGSRSKKHTQRESSMLMDKFIVCQVRRDARDARKVGSRTVRSRSRTEEDVDRMLGGGFVQFVAWVR